MRNNEWLKRFLKIKIELNKYKISKLINKKI